MISIQKAFDYDFDRVFPLLKELDAQKSTEEWRSIFKRHWEQQDPQCGYMLLDNDKVVGFIGVIITSRNINGRFYKFCDLGSWIVESDYRNHSLTFLMTVLNQKEHTFTSFSANHRAHEIFKKLGFKDYQTHWRWILPRWNIVSNDNVTICWDKTVIQTKLKGEQLKIFEDHAKFSCLHGLIENKSNGEFCYIILKRRTAKKIPCVEIHYASNYPMLLSNITRLANNVLVNLKAIGILVPEHKLQGYHVPWSLPHKLTHSRIFKSSQLSSSDIDTLYSELFILNF